MNGRVSKSLFLHIDLKIEHTSPLKYPLRVAGCWMKLEEQSALEFLTRCYRALDLTWVSCTSLGVSQKGAILGIKCMVSRMTSLAYWNSKELGGYRKGITIQSTRVSVQCPVVWIVSPHPLPPPSECGSPPTWVWGGELHWLAGEGVCWPNSDDWALFIVISLRWILKRT